MVTGASAGVGLSVAKALAATGAHVSLCDRDAQRLARAHVEVNALGPGDVLSMPVDPHDACEAAEWVHRTADAFGGLDIVVSNPGPAPPGRVDGFAIADYRAALDANLLPHVSVTLAALPIVKRGGWGRMLMIAPGRPHGRGARDGLSAVTRMGLIGYMSELVDTLADTGVTVNMLVPGAGPEFAPGTWFDPDAIPENARGAAESRRREGTDGPGGFGALAVFLTGDRAASLTGRIFDAEAGDEIGDAAPTSRSRGRR
ncbi:SDR family NAD(P)-dependent oxidoreductase [Embleya sp. NBC_00896]|uniref:SDR family NAD(P)-dependent oxidoreductase n=1 Tax=Embleya sp. NBC_00896 TaxID=2975961 RepID=UPI003870048B|nr:SDR family NAD(P)-dependent oxidoreductase [Embleya sp. NBC_00896]